MAAKKTAPKKSAFNKSEWVRDQSTTLSTKEVVAKAKAAGITLSDHYVYKVRHAAKTPKKASAKTKAPVAAKAATTTAKRATAPRTASSVKKPITLTEKTESLLRALGAELGLSNAIAILQSERERVRKVLGA